MKTEDANKTTSITFTGSDKNCFHCSMSVNLRHSLSKPQSFLNKESEKTWIQLCSSILADLTLLLLENIKFSLTKILPMIHSDFIQEDNSPELLLKDSFTIQTFLMMVTYGTSTHQWNTMTTLIPKNSKELHDLNTIRLKYSKRKFYMYKILKIN